MNRLKFVLAYAATVFGSLAAGIIAYVILR